MLFLLPPNLSGVGGRCVASKKEINITQSLRKAAIGSSLAALRAGITPAIKPTTNERLKPTTIDNTEMTKGNLKIIAAPKAIEIPENIPMAPPKMEIKTDSAKNWLRMAE